jgi:hypothetical protein
MIAQLDIYLNAAAPSLPLPVWDAFVGSPSHLRIFNVPQNIGSWRLTKIYVSVKYPDNAIRSVECTKHVGGRIWSATVSGCSTPGFAERGYEIQADGVDEHGEPVTGYVLGAGDVFIRDRDGTITVGGTSYYYHFLDDVPSAPKKCDTCVIDGVLKWYNGTAWQGFDNPAALPYKYVDASTQANYPTMVDIADRTVTKYAYDTGDVFEEPIGVFFPQYAAGKVRDFVLMLDITGSGSVKPMIFPIVDGMAEANVEYLTEDGQWPSIEVGKTLMYFSEVVPHTFLVKAVKVSDTTF